MSNYLFPTNLPGLKWGTVKKPLFSTKAKRGVSGFEVRAAFAAYPLYEFEFAYEFLRHGTYNDLRSLYGFFLARRGSLQNFLFLDPDDSVVTDELVGTGTGALSNFQLTRTAGTGVGATFTEPVYNVAAITNVKINEVVTSAYTINSAGLITTTVPVPAGQTVKWSGSYYFRCRFSEDYLDFTKFMQDLWELKKLRFVGSLQNKV